MKKRIFKIKNSQGIHTRSAATIVKHISKYSSSVTIKKDGHEVDAKSIMGILTLQAGQGSEITVEADGKDAEDVLDKMQEIIDNKFWEED